MTFCMCPLQLSAFMIFTIPPESEEPSSVFFLFLWDQETPCQRMLCSWFQGRIRGHRQYYSGHGLHESRCRGQLWDGGVARFYHHCPVFRVSLPGVHADGQSHLPLQVGDFPLKENSSLTCAANKSTPPPRFSLQWAGDQVRERVIGEEFHIPQGQEAAGSRLGVPSSPGELQHVQEGLWIQLVDDRNLSRDEFVIWALQF